MRTPLFLRRGNTLPVVVGGVLFLAFLTTLLSRFSASEEGASRPRSLYLDDESGAISRQRAKRQATELASRKKVEKARRRKARNQRTLAFRHAASGLLFRGPGAGEPALETDLHALLTSTQVLHRVFGGAEGDFLYHRTKGWMRFQDGRWVRVADEELPQSVVSAYPALVGRNSGGGDSKFQTAPWMGAIDEEEEG